MGSSNFIHFGWFEAPFENFTWDLQEYTSEGTHQLKVEARDSLGLVGTSAEIPVYVTLVQPTENPWAGIQHNMPLLIGLIVLVAGAILVLFLFVIMLLNLRGSEDLGAKAPPVARFTKYLFSILLVVELVMIVRSGFYGTLAGGGADAPLAADFGSVPQVAELLFTRYLYPFELTSILLLAAIVGAVVMAKRDNQEIAQTETLTESSEGNN